MIFYHCIEREELSTVFEAITLHTDIPCSGDDWTIGMSLMIRHCDETYYRTGNVREETFESSRKHIQYVVRRRVSSYLLIVSILSLNVKGTIRLELIIINESNELLHHLHYRLFRVVENLLDVASLCQKVTLSLNYFVLCRQ